MNIEQNRKATAVETAVGTYFPYRRVNVTAHPNAGNDNITATLTYSIPAANTNATAYFKVTGMLQSFLLCMEHEFGVKMHEVYITSTATDLTVRFTF